MCMLFPSFGRGFRKLGGGQKRAKAYKERRGFKIAVLERTYFMDGPRGSQANML